MDTGAASRAAAGGQVAGPGGALPGPDLAVHTLVADDQESAAGRKQGHGDPGRMPVMVVSPPPPWRPLPDRAGRRPVVALPDTGVKPHPWLAGTPGDPVVLDAGGLGWEASTSRVGDGPFHGHATFLAGVIRQTAPGAQVLSVPVMGDDGIVAGSESLRALSWLAGLARGGQAGRFVDVICLAYGYQPGRGDQAHLARLREVLWDLASHGVLIVASAGNEGSPEPAYPAAFAADQDPPAVPLTSVGATNPDGTYAHYSNYGGWVTHQAAGSGVISTIAAFDGAQPAPPQTSFPRSIGSTIDPDNFTGGFARWSGTSFAAADIAGRLAHALGHGPGLADRRPAAAAARARAALASIQACRART
jgi:subtilase family protein